MSDNWEEKLENKNAVPSQWDYSEETATTVLFEHHLETFLSGDLHFIKDEVFSDGLVQLFEKENCPDLDRLNDILDTFMAAVLSADMQIREGILPVLDRAAGFFLDLNLVKGVFCISPILTEWFRSETETPPGAEAVVSRMVECLECLLISDTPGEGLLIFELLHQAETGELSKNSTLQELAATNLKGLLRQDIVSLLLDSYLKEDSRQELCERCITALGPETTLFILEKIVQEGGKHQQKMLRQLIAGFKESALPVVHDLLQERLSWGEIRHLIFVLGEIGKTQSYQHIQRYFGAADDRVQLEAIHAVSKIGGDQTRDRLLHALPLVSERLKLYLLRQLVEMGAYDDKLFQAVTGLAAQRATFSLSVGTELLTSLLSVLKMFPQKETITLLEELKKDYQHGVGVAHIMVLIDTTINAIEPVLRHNTQRQETLGDDVSFYDDPSSAETDGDGAEELEQFLTSQTLEGQGGKHGNIWKDLSDSIGQGGLSALFNITRRERYTKGERVVNTGEIDSCLFFLTSGSLGITYDTAGQQTFLRRAYPGDILGCDQFFSTSVWTVNVQALSSAQLQVLDQQGWQELCQETPSVEKALQQYCQRFDNIANLVKTSGDDRRGASRYPLNLVTQHVLVDPFGKESKRGFRGRLIDISASGVAFSVRLASRSISKALLGRQIITRFQLTEGVNCELTGVIVGVKFHDQPSQSYSVHIRLGNTLDEAQLTSILASADNSSG